MEGKEERKNKQKNAFRANAAFCLLFWNALGEEKTGLWRQM